MVFIDSNVPMYVLGAEHPTKSAAVSMLERLIRDEVRLVSDAEVLQEILHRYIAINRRDAIQPAFDALLGLVDEVFPVESGDLVRAKDVLLSTSGLSARDAVHAAVMYNRGVERILSYDSGFDALPFLTRLS
ncbi:MAG: type II toxin-antitoxin system VapC family toxin [Spirochaetaceae bacterium]